MIQNSLSRFVDNGDGTITDTQTNLVWQKQDDGHKRTLEEAKAYCNELSLGGHNVWRLPTIEELKVTSSYWKQVFADTKDDEPYWSSTVHKNPYPKATESQKYAAEVMFSSGETNQYFVIYHYYVRAVCDSSQKEQKNTITKKCPDCGELIGEQFDECWQCSAEQIEENKNISADSREKKKTLLAVKINAFVEVILAFVIIFVMRGYLYLVPTGEIAPFAFALIIGPWLIIIGGTFHVLLTNKKRGHIVVLIGFLCVALSNLLIPSDFPQYIQPNILIFLSAVFVVIEAIIIKFIFSRNESSLKPKKNKIIKTVFVIIGALVWWLIVFVKNPSNLGPGITLGHLIQAAVIFIIAFVIAKIIWWKK